jgi:hypothetical protein
LRIEHLEAHPVEAVAIKNSRAERAAHQRGRIFGIFGAVQGLLSELGLLIHSSAADARSGGVIGLAMPSKRTTKAPQSRADRAAEQADYASWKITAGADLLERYDVKPGTIPEHLWR